MQRPCLTVLASRLDPWLFADSSIMHSVLAHFMTSSRVLSSWPDISYLLCFLIYLTPSLLFFVDIEQFITVCLKLLLLFVTCTNGQQSQDCIRKSGM